MNKTIKGAVIGGVLGITAPLALAVANEFVWSRSSGGVVEPRICFAERLWNLQRVQIVHAPGCKNNILNSIPLCLLVGVLSGSLISALSLITKETQKQSKDSSAEPACTSTPPTPVAGIKPPTAPVEQKLTIPPISLPSISPKINKGVDRLKGLDWNTIAKGTAVAGGILVIGYGAAYLLRENTENTTNSIVRHGNSYTRTYNQNMGTASTGEPVLLISVKTEFRGGIGSWVKYKIGSDTVESIFSCPVSKSDGRPHFSEQGVRYASSTATAKVLSIACSYHKFISDKYGHLYETSP